MKSGNDTPVEKLHQPYVLLADDDVDDRLFLQTFFTVSGLAHCQFESGKEAVLFLQLLEKEQLPSVILLDYHMPLLTGEQVLQILRSTEKFRQLPVLLYSSEMTDALRRRLLQLGATACFAKGDAAELVALKNLLTELCTKKVNRFSWLSQPAASQFWPQAGHR